MGIVLLAYFGWFLLWPWVPGHSFSTCLQWPVLRQRHEEVPCVVQSSKGPSVLQLSPCSLLWAFSSLDLLKLSTFQLRLTLALPRFSFLYCHLETLPGLEMDIGCVFTSLIVVLFNVHVAWVQCRKPLFCMIYCFRGFFGVAFFFFWVVLGGSSQLQRLIFFFFFFMNKVFLIVLITRLMFSRFLMSL